MGARTWLLVALVMGMMGAVGWGSSASAQAPPNITVGKDANGDGWIYCYTRVEAVKWRFKCPVFPYGGTQAAIGGWWKVAKCAAAIVAFVAGNVAAISKLRKAGGVWKVAKRLIKAKGVGGKAAVIAAVFGDITGITGVIEACGG